MTVQADKWTTRGAKDRLEATVSALRGRGILAEIVPTREAALARLHELIPPGTELMTGASVTLKEIGLETELRDGTHPWKWLKPAILAETDKEREKELRRRSSSADCFVGSVQAVTETGEVVVASGSGSQIAAYTYSSPLVVWVVGSQKLVSNAEEALQRIRQWCVPKMEEMTKTLGRPDLGVVGKILFLEREMPHLERKVHLVFVEDLLGF